MITVNDISVDFQPGMVLADVLNVVGIDTESPLIITVDDVYVDKQDIRSAKLHDSTVIRVLPFLSGG